MGRGRTIHTLCGGVAVLLAYAQPQWTAPIAPVDRDGYYTIVLSPEVVGRSHDGLVDLRLLDSTGKEVPYLIEVERAVYETSAMRPFHLLRNERTGARTVVEMEIAPKATIDELNVRVRNARVSKSARITGSDDRVMWYMIQDQCLSVGEDRDASNVLRFMDLPLSDYRYYRLELDDSLSAPVQVLELGHVARTRTEGRYTRIDDLAFTRLEKGVQTHIGLSAGAPFIADRVLLAVVNKEPYRRTGDFYTNTWVMRKDRRRERRDLNVSFHGRFLLASYARGALPAPGIATDTLWLSIENGNDAPLRIESVQAFQLERRLRVKLNSGERYLITTGDAKAWRPQYDIEHFRDSLPPSLAVLNMPTMTARPVAPEEGPAIAPSMKWVWAAIIGIGAIIAISAVRLLRKSSTTME